MIGLTARSGYQSGHSGAGRRALGIVLSDLVIPEVRHRKRDIEFPMSLASIWRWLSLAPDPGLRLLNDP
jgi:hypothetical protein